MSAAMVLSWLLHTLLGGGSLLLLAWVWMRRLAAPARRQRLGEWAIAAALLLAILSFAPAWLVVTLPSQVGEIPPPPPPATAGDNEPSPISPTPRVERAAGAEPVGGQEPPAAIAPEAFLTAPPDDFPVPAAAPPLAEENSDAKETATPNAHPLLLTASVLYLGGFGLLAARWLLGHVVLWRMLRRTEPVPPVVAELFAAMTPGGHRPRLLLSRRARVPFSCGLVRPTVVLPVGLAHGASRMVLRWVFTHELTHLRRRDAWSGAVFGLGQALYFPLPWFWWLRRQVRLCQEYIADAAAAGVGCPADYAQFLLSWTVAPAAPAGVLGVSGSPSDLFRRITMLLQTPAPVEPRCPRRWSLPAAGGLLTLAVLVAGVGLTTQAAPVPRKDETKKATKTDEPKKAEIGKDKITKDETKKDKSDDLDEVFKNAPPGMDPAQLKQMRESLERALRNVGPEHAKHMREQWARMLQHMGPHAAAGFQAGGVHFGGLMDPRGTVRLGARVEPPGATLAEQLDLPKGQGLVLREVLPDSAAAKAGLKRHDVLLEINGKPVPDQQAGLVKLLSDIKPDTKVDAVVLRKGKKETIKGLSLPEAKAVAPGAGNFAPPGAGLGVGVGNFAAGGGFPAANFGGFMQQGGGGQSVITTMFRTQDRFTLRHQEGSLVITLTGKVADGKAKVNEINVQDGAQTHKYESLDKVPEQYHDKAKNLIEMSEKGNARIEIKSP
jgi:beta-lactamase regulating signal transducer with metallopeptidase domain